MWVDGETLMGHAALYTLLFVACLFRRLTRSLALSREFCYLTLFPTAAPTLSVLVLVALALFISEW